MQQNIQSEINNIIIQEIRPYIKDIIGNSIKDMFGNTPTPKTIKKNRVFNNTKIKPVEATNKPLKATVTPQRKYYNSMDISDIIRSQKILPNAELIRIFGKIGNYSKTTINTKVNDILKLDTKELFKKYPTFKKSGEKYSYLNKNQKIEALYRLMGIQKFSITKSKLLLNAIKNTLKADLTKINGNWSDTQIKKRNGYINESIDLIDKKLLLAPIHFKGN